VPPVLCLLDESLVLPCPIAMDVIGHARHPESLVATTLLDGV